MFVMAKFSSIITILTKRVKMVLKATLWPFRHMLHKCETRRFRETWTWILCKMKISDFRAFKSWKKRIVPLDKVHLLARVETNSVYALRSRLSHHTNNNRSLIHRIREWRGVKRRYQCLSERSRHRAWWTSRVCKTMAFLSKPTKHIQNMSHRACCHNVFLSFVYRST